jgi:hypothetical protein
MRHRLGRPLPHQQADTPRADPRPPELCPSHHAVCRGYPVLTTVSRGYPGVQGTLPTCYSPVRRFQPGLLRVLVSTLDLHVLSTPPAFVLSQDQTLRRDFETVFLGRTQLELRRVQLTSCRIHLVRRQRPSEASSTLSLTRFRWSPIHHPRSMHTQLPSKELIVKRTGGFSAGTLFSSQGAAFRAKKNAGQEHRRAT